MKTNKLEKFKEILGLYRLESKLRVECIQLLSKVKPNSPESDVQAVLYSLAELSLVSAELKTKWEEWDSSSSRQK